MPLTTNDLQAIQAIFDASIDEKVKPLIDASIDEKVKPLIEETIDSLAQSTADGFAEVHEKLDAIQSNVQELKDSYKTLDRTVDTHESRIRALELAA